MTETLQGVGRLRSISAPRAEFSVRYCVDFRTGLEQRPGFPPFAIRSTATVRLENMASEVIPPGFYELETEDGELIRLQSFGPNDWNILSQV